MAEHLIINGDEVSDWYYADQKLPDLELDETLYTRDDFKAEREGYIQDLESRLEELWVATRGVMPNTGRMWLTPRMEREAAATVEGWAAQDKEQKENKKNETLDIES